MQKSDNSELTPEEVEAIKREASKYLMMEKVVEQILSKERQRAKVLVDALRDIVKWDEKFDDEWGDPGARAIEALTSYNNE